MNDNGHSNSQGGLIREISLFPEARIDRALGYRVLQEYNDETGEYNISIRGKSESDIFPIIAVKEALDINGNLFMNFAFSSGEPTVYLRKSPDFLPESLQPGIYYVSNGYFETFELPDLKALSARGCYLVPISYVISSIVTDRHRTLPKGEKNLPDIRRRDLFTLGRSGFNEFSHVTGVRNVQALLSKTLGSYGQIDLAAKCTYHKRGVIDPVLITLSASAGNPKCSLENTLEIKPGKGRTHSSSIHTGRKTIRNFGAE